VYFQRTPREFGRRTAYGVARRQLLVADTDNFEVRAYTADGNLIEIIRRKHEPIPVTSADVHFLRESQLAGASEGRRESIGEMHTRLPDPPEALPAMDPMVLFDADDRLWLPKYHWPPDAPYRWSVFDRNGRLVATVHTPSDLDVLGVGAKSVLGVWKDEDDVEYVRLYELVEGSS
jgi:hypothetical protein